VLGKKSVIQIVSVEAKSKQLMQTPLKIVSDANLSPLQKKTSPP